jgi:di/tricarboxylate transporter
LSAYFVVLVVVAMVAGLVSSRVSAVAVFASALGALFFAGVVSIETVLSKATNTGLVTLLTLISVSFGLEKLGVLSTLANKLISPSLNLSILKLGSVTALCSAFLNNTAVVATLASSLQRNSHHAPSQLLIVLSYAAIMGGTMTLIGTSTNLIVNSFLIDQGETGFSLFAFLPIGLAATVAGLGVLALTSARLPKNTSVRKPIADYLVEVEVMPSSSLIGKSVKANKLRDLQGLFLVEIYRDNRLITPVTPSEVLRESDKLIFSGDVSRIAALEQFDGLRTFAMEEGLLRSNLTEVIVLPGATVEGKSIKAAGFRSLFDAAVVGVSRGGLPLSGKLGDIVLRAGDSLVLATGADFNRRNNLRRNFVVIDDRLESGRVSGRQSGALLFGLALVVFTATMGWINLLTGLALLLAVMLISGVVSGDELRRRFPFDLWIIITAALCVSQALADTGLVSAAMMALTEGSGGINPLLALVVVYLVTLVLTELMTNTAAAALVFPLAASLAQSLHLDLMPFAAAVAFGASASFLTPFGYTTNLMVQNMGGYRLQDYLRLGSPVSLVYTIVALTLIPIVFPLTPLSP